jgi:uncharacterized membrane protein YeaQ/YmgE (transglycosylase-associated protein family)
LPLWLWVRRSARGITREFLVRVATRLICIVTVVLGIVGAFIGG